MKLFFLTAVFVFAVDFTSKVLVREFLRYGVPVPVFGDFFRLTFVENTGVVFGLFRGKGLSLLPLMILALIVILVYVFLRSKSHPARLEKRNLWTSLDEISLGMIFGGGFANVFERLTRGVVTDFIDVGIKNIRWYTFNVADSFIVIGVIVQFLLILRGEFSSGASD